jgi:hypothetical protein
MSHLLSFCTRVWACFVELKHEHTITPTVRVRTLVRGLTLLARSLSGGIPAIGSQPIQSASYLRRSRPSPFTV